VISEYEAGVRGGREKGRGVGDCARGRCNSARTIRVHAGAWGGVLRSPGWERGK